MTDSIDDPDAYLATQYRKIEAIAATTEQTLLAYEAAARPSHATAIASLQDYQPPRKSPTTLTEAQRRRLGTLIAHAAQVAKATQGLNINTKFGASNSYKDPTFCVGFCVTVSAIVMVLVTVILVLILVF